MANKKKNGTKKGKGVVREGGRQIGTTGSTRSQNARFSRMSGSERLPNSVDATLSGQEWVLNMREWADLRLGREASLWEKWHVHSLRFEYVPNLSNVDPGTIVLAMDYDPDDSRPATAAEALSTYGAKEGPARHGLSVTMDNFKLPDGQCIRPSLFCDPLGVPRLTWYGKLYAYTDGVTYVGTTGHIVMHYDITLAIPQLTSAEPWIPTTINEVRATPVNPGGVVIPNEIQSATGNGVYTQISGAGTSLYPGTMVRAIVEAVQDGVITSGIRKAVRIGAEIFGRACTQVSTPGGGVQPVSSTTTASEWYSSPDFNPATKITFNADSGAPNMLVQLRNSAYRRAWL